MYILRNPLCLFGIFISALAPVFSPFLRVPVKGNWNLYQTDVSLFLITYALLGLCVLGFFMRKVSLYRLFTRIYLGWCIVAFAAVFFKVNNYFGMRLLDGLMAKTIDLKWGWLILFIGALLLAISVKKLQPIVGESTEGDTQY